MKNVKRAIVLLALIMSCFPLTPTAFAAAKSPAQVAEDCADPRPTQAGDIIYWDPECYLTFKSSKQVWGEATMPDKLGGGNSPIAYGCTSSGSVSVAGTKSSSTSFSFGLDIGGKKKFGDWEASVGPKLGWSWTWSTSDTHTHTATVPLGSVGWIEVREPLIEAVVDIDARYDGNRNELVKNAVVRVPDTSRSFAWLYQSRKMTDAELRDICGQDPPATKTYDMWSAGGKAPYKNLLSGKCLAIGPTVPNGGLVVQRTCDGGAAQKWNAVKASNGYFTIRNNNGYCLTVPYNNGTPPGQNTQLMWWGCETRWDSGNQLWSVNPTKISGTYTFTNQWTGLCLAPHSSEMTKNGGRVTIRKCA
ncbi:RICIN domain-containing protein [Kitasatospora sp. NPDC093806]|uniref:RICIN domain-containing protein n=1 Tax=Kitasatospora sp. NPDC093806 TaxID=3155075 RepID=UPI003424E09E